METIKINNNIKEDEVPLYNPQGKLIGIIKNELAFNDIRIQIYKNKLEGYYIIWKDRVYKFNKYGHNLIRKQLIFLKKNGLMQFVLIMI